MHNYIAETVFICIMLILLTTYVQWYTGITLEERAAKNNSTQLYVKCTA